MRLTFSAKYRVGDKVQVLPGEHNFNLKEVCDRLQISRNTAYSLLKRGDLEGVKVSRMWRIPDRSIWNYIMQSDSKKEEIYHGQEEEQESK